ncbi:unnamed protein product [Thlaspi arvense]|uniref:Phytochrome A-associated F-box protein n=1 Tax=Thlaspi arvense TaxID=13288 RepID=A0AAU9SXG8_THLAR|nr:unnamed protein product [Thlaspi arvense]
MAESGFSFVPEDVVFNIFFKLQDDPRNWARLACVCTKFSSIVRNVCCKTQCYSAIPTVISDLLPSPSAASASASSSSASADSSLPPPGGWASLYKLAVCCPGLLHAGILLENSDFGLERELGPDQSLDRLDPKPIPTDPARDDGEVSNPIGSTLETSSFWSLYDDLYTDTLSAPPEESVEEQDEIETSEIRPGRDLPARKRRKICRSLGSHLASGAWNLSREQGNKLLASRFRGDCLYICNWPGCIHVEEKRNYMLFRGVFKDFKRSRVWRTINDGGNRSKVSGLKCAFCVCDETWDLHSSFCLRRVFGFHDDGEPVVRAYVCENGHVSGAWTALPLYT